MMHAVAHIDIQRTWGSEHHGVASGLALCRMTSLIAIRWIRLHLDQTTAADPVTPDYLAHQVRCDHRGRSSEELMRERAAHLPTPLLPSLPPASAPPPDAARYLREKPWQL